MKITLLTPALVAILGLALAGAPVTTQAQTPTPSPTTASSTPTKAPKPATTSYSGTLTAISSDATSITVQGSKSTLTLEITPATKIQKDKKPATLTDFAVGDKVTGSYTKDAGGTMTAYSLHKKTVSTPKPMKAPTPTPKPVTQ